MRPAITSGLAVVSALVLCGCATGAAEGDDAHEVVYSITGDGTTSTSITYVTVNGADVSQAEITDVALPWNKKITVPDGALSNGILRLAGRLGATGTTISCDISVDGKSIASLTSIPDTTAVTCNGSNQSYPPE
jgi:hypothetical protein